MAGLDRHRYDVFVARLAGRQDGVVTRRQLLAGGIEPGWIERGVKAGRFIRVYQGVYAVGHAALGDRGRVRAALLAAGPEAIASHTTAAALYRLFPSMPAVLHVTTGDRARRRRSGLVIHQTKRPPEVRTIRGIPLTAPLRTLADLAATQPAATVERATTEALNRRLVRPEEVRHGAPARSALERRFRRLVADAGLPPPLMNQRIGSFEVDFLWPAHRVIAETDGWATHGTRRAFEHDRAKDAALLAAGYLVVRFTWRQIDERPLAVAARLAQVLARCSVAA